MSSLDPYNLTFWIRIGLSLVCGLVIGLERQLRGKPAGMRTSIMICAGATIFVMLSSVEQAGTVDPTRVIGQVATGVGFLGAGVIMTRSGIVVGMTSAAVIWVLAAIGCTIGSGHHAAAIALTGVALFVLVGIDLLERSVRTLRRGVHALRSSSDVNGGSPEEEIG